MLVPTSSGSCFLWNLRKHSLSNLPNSVWTLTKFKSFDYQFLYFIRISAIKSGAAAGFSATDLIRAVCSSVSALSWLELSLTLCYKFGEFSSSRSIHSFLRIGPPRPLIHIQCAHTKGKMVEKGFAVDLNQPLVFQVGHLGKDYQEWVHQPIVRKESPLFFKNKFLEFNTRTAWWVIPIVWLPVVSCAIYGSSLRGLAPAQLTGATILGILLWTLMEYSLHRFLFHINTTGYWENTFHYMIHGCHHKYPLDPYRLVFPPAATAILCVPFWFLVKLLIPYSSGPAVFGGGLLGYVMYDLIHYYLHHGTPSQHIPRKLKKYHLNHHFRIQTSGFGITSSLWDWVFGTLPPKKKE